MPILLAGELDEAERTVWLRCLRAALPDEVLVTDRVGLDVDDIDIAIVANPPAGSLRGLPKLRLIQSLWAGVDKLLRDATIPVDVPLARMVDPAMNDAMAQTALWAVLALHRGFFAYGRQQREIEWKQHAQRRADEIGVAVLGLGEMGLTVATRLRGNGYGVSGWSRNPSQVKPSHMPDVETHHGIAALPTVLAQADVVVNLLPLTDETRGLFDKSRFVQMRRGAALVNLARGAHVVDADLLEALDSGQIGHAVLDVFHTEPLPPDHAFWRHLRVTVLPHAAAATDPRSASRAVADNVQAIRTGVPPRHVVDRSRGY
jgi:glyoxylate/hydroxypyruvate reductase A